MSFLRNLLNSFGNHGSGHGQSQNHGYGNKTQSSGHHGQSHNNQYSGNRHQANFSNPSSIACPSCQRAQANSAKFCQDCGTSLLPKQCDCGASISVGSKFCGQCGKST